MPSFSVIAWLALRARKGARRHPGAGAQEVFPVGDRSKNKRGLEIRPRSSGFEYHLALCKHGPAFVPRGGPRSGEAGPGSRGCDTSAAPDTGSQTSPGRSALPVHAFTPCRQASCPSDCHTCCALLSPKCSLLLAEDVAFCFMKKTELLNLKNPSISSLPTFPALSLNVSVFCLPVLLPP